MHLAPQAREGFGACAHGVVGFRALPAASLESQMIVHHRFHHPGPQRQDERRDDGEQPGQQLVDPVDGGMQRGDDASRDGGDGQHWQRQAARPEQDQVDQEAQHPRVDTPDDPGGIVDLCHQGKRQPDDRDALIFAVVRPGAWLWGGVREMMGSWIACSPALLMSSTATVGGPPSGSSSWRRWTPRSRGICGSG